MNKNEINLTEIKLKQNIEGTNIKVAFLLMNESLQITECGSYLKEYINFSVSNSFYYYFKIRNHKNVDFNKLMLLINSSIILESTFVKDFTLSGKLLYMGSSIGLLFLGNNLDERPPLTEVKYGGENDQLKQSNSESTEYLVLVNLDLDIIWIDESFKKRIGYEEWEYKGCNLQILMALREYQGVNFDFIKGKMKRNESVNIDLVLQDKSMNYFHINVQGRPFYHSIDDDSCQKYILHCQEIKNKMGTITKLENIKSKFASLIDNTKDYFFEYVFFLNGKQGFRLLSANSILENIISENEIFPLQNNRDFFSEQDFNKLYNQIQKCKYTKASFYYQGNIEMPNKEEISFTISALYSYESEDGSIVYTGILSNITEKETYKKQVQSEREFHSEILDQIPSQVVVFNKRHEYVYINPEAIKNSGLRIRMIGKRDENLCKYKKWPLSIAKQRRTHFAALLASKQVQIWEEKLTEINGSSKYYGWQYHPIFDKHGEIHLVIGNGLDITELKKKEDSLVEANNKLREFVNYIQDKIEKERKFLAQEVHDHLGQLITGVKINASWINNNLLEKDTKISIRIKDMIQSLDEMVNSVRDIATSLRPSILDNFGLIAGIENYVNQFRKRMNINTEFICNIDEDKANNIFTNEMTTALFRICQESLTNAMRHAKATKIIVKIWEEDNNYTMLIQDNGIGFDTTQKHNSLGLLGIKERAISVNCKARVISEINKGTDISIEIPKK